MACPRRKLEEMIVKSKQFELQPLTPEEAAVDPEDVGRLRPIDPASDGLLPEIVTATRLISEKLGDRAFLLAEADQGPFSLATQIVGIEAMLMATFNYPATIVLCSRKQMRDVVKKAPAPKATPAPVAKSKPVVKKPVTRPAPPAPPKKKVRAAKFTPDQLKKIRASLLEKRSELEERQRELDEASFDSTQSDITGEVGIEVGRWAGKGAVRTVVGMSRSYPFCGPCFERACEPVRPRHRRQRAQRVHRRHRWSTPSPGRSSARCVGRRSRVRPRRGSRCLPP